MIGMFSAAGGKDPNWSIGDLGRWDTSNVRALARDILAKLNQIGTLSELCRTSIDDINIDECDRLEDVLDGKYTKHSLLDVLSKRYKTCEVNNVEDIKNGKRIKIDSDEKYLLLISNGELLAMYVKDGSEYKSARGLWYFL